MGEAHPTGDWSELTSAHPDEGEVLVERLRVVAEALGGEFAGLSRADAERLILRAAQEVLSTASVMQFVPTFTERRARQILHREGLPTTAGSSPDATTTEPAPPAPRRPDPRPPAPPPSSFVASPTPVPRWPDRFYATEGKRLLERARLLRGATGGAGREA